MPTIPVKTKDDIALARLDGQNPPPVPSPGPVPVPTPNPVEPLFPAPTWGQFGQGFLAGLNLGTGEEPPEYTPAGHLGQTFGVLTQVLTGGHAGRAVKAPRGAGKASVINKLADATTPEARAALQAEARKQVGRTDARQTKDVFERFLADHPTSEATPAARAEAQTAARELLAGEPITAGRTAPPRAKMIDEAIRLAEKQTTLNAPGKVSDVLQKIPGIKQAREWERPELGMTGENVNISVAMKAEFFARNHMQAKALATRIPLVSKLEAAFSKSAMRDVRTDVPFIGPAEQAAHEQVGKLVDIMQRPHFYRLTPEQAAALGHGDFRNTDLLNYANREYETAIGEWPTAPGGMFVPNLRVGDDAARIDAELLNVAAGRSKERFYPSAYDRMIADPTFKPNNDVYKLLEEMDRFKSGAAAGQTFRKAAGGLTKADVVQRVNPELYKRWTSLHNQLYTLRSAGQVGEGVIDDFLAGPMDDDALDMLFADLSAPVGARSDEAAKVRESIAALRPAWRTVDLHGYTKVGAGINRWFPDAQAKLIVKSREAPTNPIVKILEEIRAGVFGPDASPLVGVQTLLHALASPMGFVRRGRDAIGESINYEGRLKAKILRSFTLDALAKDMREDPAWAKFFTLFGAVPRTGEKAEFAAGYWGKLPIIGKHLNAFTESTFISVTRQAKSLWEDTAKQLVLEGVPLETAEIAAMDRVTEVIPMFRPALQGLSPRRAALLRALPTSYSFLRQPPQLIAHALRGILKYPIGVERTPSEKLAMRFMLRMAVTAAAASIISAVLEARRKGQDEDEAAWKAINPDPKNGAFLSLVLGDIRVPLGGPYRALFRAIYASFDERSYDRDLLKTPLIQYAANRMNPFLQTHYNLVRNEDFYGHKIRQGDFGVQLAQWAIAEGQGLLPLTASTAVEGLRAQASGAQIREQVLGQAVGANISPTVPVREKVGQWEVEKRLPPIDAPLSELTVAYQQAGEGRLSKEARAVWGEYERQTPDGKKALLMSLPKLIRLELLLAERYRPIRRQQLARNFPALDVWVVEDRWTAVPRRQYRGVTPAGRKRYAELQRGTGVSKVKQALYTSAARR